MSIWVQIPIDYKKLGMATCACNSSIGLGRQLSPMQGDGDNLVGIWRFQVSETFCLKLIRQRIVEEDTCRTVIAQGYGGRVEAASTPGISNMRMSGVSYLCIPKLVP